MILTSVPHSGTRFFHYLLDPDETEHFGVKRLGRMLAGDRVRVCVLRRPEAVWQSWWNRGGVRRVEGWSEADRTGKGPSGLWDRSWKDLERYSGEYDFHWLPVDTDDREDCLKVLCEVLGRPVPETDWKPLRVSRFWERAPEIDFGWIYRIPVIDRFYGRV